MMRGSNGSGCTWYSGSTAVSSWSGGSAQTSVGSSSAPTPGPTSSGGSSWSRVSAGLGPSVLPPTSPDTRRSQ